MRKLRPSGFCFTPLHPREPRQHASHKARHRGGSGAKEDVIEATDTRAMRGIRVYLERRGFEILEEGWARGGDVVDFIVRDEEDLVFVSCQVTQNGGEGFPGEDADRAALERLAVAYLAEHFSATTSTRLARSKRRRPREFRLPGALLSVTSCWPCCCDVLLAPCVAS